MRSLVLRAAAVVALLVVPSAAQAGSFLPAYTGNTIIGRPVSLTDGVVNFGVYQSTTTNFFTELFGATVGALFQTANAGINADSEYIFIYSVVNTGLPNNDADQALITFTVDGRHATGVGAFQSIATPTAPGNAGTRAAFTDGDTSASGLPAGAVGPNPNRRLGANNVIPPGSGDVAGNETPSFAGVTNAGVAAVPVASGAPSEIRNVTSATLSGGQASFSFLLADGQTSTLFFVTSNNRPTYGVGTVVGANNGASTGDVPVPTPEPGTLALLGLGLPVLGWGYARRLRANKAVAAVVAQ